MSGQGVRTLEVGQMYKTPNGARAKIIKTFTDDGIDYYTVDQEDLQETETYTETDLTEKIEKEGWKLI